MRSSSFLCLLGLAFFLQSFTPSDAGDLKTICNLVGGFYVTPEFCLPTFREDPRSETADSQGLGVISVDILIKNSTSTKQKAELLLKNAADPRIKHRLEILLTIYNNALRGLEWSKKSIAAGFRAGPKLISGQTTEMAGAAATSLDEGLESLGNDNTNFQELSNFVMSVINVI